MKIDKILVGCDDNSTYLPFWKIFDDTWKKIGFDTILGYVSENKLDQNNVINFRPINGINTGFQAQLIRLYLTKYFKDQVCCISDIDMIPLSKNYYIEIIKNINENNLVITSSDAYFNRFPMCYLIAKGEVFSDILDLDKCTWEEFVNRLYIEFNGDWGTDELYFFKKWNQWDKKNTNTILLKRGWDEKWIANDRIDRSYWNYNIEKLKNGGYIDSHLLRPYIENKIEIEKLINYIYEDNKL